MRKLGNVLRKSIPTVAALVTAVAGIYLAIANINEVALVIGGDILNRFMLGLILLVAFGLILRGVNLWYFAEDWGNLDEPVPFYWPRWLFCAYFEGGLSSSDAIPSMPWKYARR